MHDKVLQLTGLHLEETQDLDNWIIAKWQQQWNLTEKGRRPWTILPSIQKRLDLKHFIPDRGMVQYITGHSPFPTTKLNQLELNVSNLCECGAIGTPGHVLCCPVDTDLDIEKIMSDWTYH